MTNQRIALFTLLFQIAVATTPDAYAEGDAFAATGGDAIHTRMQQEMNAMLHESLAEMRANLQGDLRRQLSANHALGDALGASVHARESGGCGERPEAGLHASGTGPVDGMRRINAPTTTVAAMDHRPGIRLIAARETPCSPNG